THRAIDRSPVSRHGGFALSPAAGVSWMVDLNFGSSPPDRPSGASRPVILVIEDDASNRALLQTVLERDGYAVASMADGEAGFRSVGEHNPDLVLLDVGLPKLDGYEVTRRLPSDPAPANLPILPLP